jgi:Tfp pilus assembly protein PilO
MKLTIDLKAKKGTRLSGAVRQMADSVFSGAGTVKGLELFITIGTVVLLAIFAIRPTLTTMSKLLKDIQELKQTDDALSAKIQALSKADNAIFENQEDVDLLYVVLPDEAQVSGLATRVEKVASELNFSDSGDANTSPLIIRSMSTDDVPKDEYVGSKNAGLKSYSLTMEVEGSFEQITRFIQELQKIDRILTFDSLSIQENSREKLKSKDETKQSDLLRASMKMKVSYFGSIQPVDESDKKTNVQAEDKL